MLIKMIPSCHKTQKLQSREQVSLLRGNKISGFSVKTSTRFMFLTLTGIILVLLNDLEDLVMKTFTV